MKPSWYNDARYYERMLAGITTLLVEQEWFLLKTFFPWFAFHSETPEARFSPGDTVRVIAKATRGHTRCPAYIRGKEGVQLVYPIAYYPELRAHSTVKRREHSHAVEFAAAHVDGDPSQTGARRTY